MKNCDSTKTVKYTDSTQKHCVNSKSNKPKGILSKKVPYSAVFFSAFLGAVGFSVTSFCDQLNNFASANVAHDPQQSDYVVLFDPNIFENHNYLFDLAIEAFEERLQTGACSGAAIELKKANSHSASFAEKLFLFSRTKIKKGPKPTLDCAKHLLSQAMKFYLLALLSGEGETVEEVGSGPARISPLVDVSQKGFLLTYLSAMIFEQVSLSTHDQLLEKVELLGEKIETKIRLLEESGLKPTEVSEENRTRGKTYQSNPLDDALSLQRTALKLKRDLAAGVAAQPQIPHQEILECAVKLERMRDDIRAAPMECSGDSLETLLNAVKNQSSDMAYLRDEINFLELEHL
ncbi:MAG: hypothetical protein COT74_07590 [Bdellovibrionales bacterium CG10_big_fil_rev_8_21_14_0_10_45_34]|nr:MAG: hypothetical protein COT74_07590 [Bdellovibrionales bacterium CG10_big_fil_rev_8_21_14_0_10_45_34]